MDATVNELAQMLISSWVLARPEDPLPTSDGILDAALQECVRDGEFPVWFRDRLRFSSDVSGVRCIELAAILEEAQASKLTEAPNPTYTRTVVRATQFMAESMAFDLDLPVADVETWGKALVAAVERQISAYDNPVGSVSAV